MLQWKHFETPKENTKERFIICQYSKIIILKDEDYMTTIKYLDKDSMNSGKNNMLRSDEMSASLAEKMELVTRNAAEIFTTQELEHLLASKTRPSVYIGRATTGPLHIGHLASLSKLLDLQKAGFETIVLLADIHAVLDDLKSKWDEL
mgnify:FL=1